MRSYEHVALFCALALGFALVAEAKPPARYLPLRSAAVFQHIQKAIAAADQAEVERGIQVLVVLGKRARDDVSRELANERSTIRPALLEALSRMAPEMRLLARPLLRHKMPDIRAMAAMALRGADRNILVLALEREKDQTVQFSLIDSLAECEDPQATLDLCERLTSPNPKLRSKTLDGLRLRRDSRALPEVHAALRDSDPRVRTAGIQAVAAIGDQRSIMVLLDLVRIETSPHNVDTIWEALAEMTGQTLPRDADAWERWLSSGS